MIASGPLFLTTFLGYPRCLPPIDDDDDIDDDIDDDSSSNNDDSSNSIDSNDDDDGIRYLFWMIDGQVEPT
jgi:hypothetical protein